jgi:hypothetical protein
MSSHHFVKEGQEPALLIVDAVSFERAAPLLEWVPTVIVLEAALKDVLQWAIKVDIVIGKKAGLDLLTDLLMEQAPVKLLPVDNSQDAVKAALDFIRTSHQNGVNVLAHPNDDLFRKLEGYAQLGISLISEDLKWSLCTTIFQKWFPASQKLWLRETQPHQSLRWEGLQDIGGQFETKADGFIQVHSGARFWVGEPL